MRNLAERLIAYERTQNKITKTKTPPEISVFDRLRPQLATLMGNAGFRAILTRALVLSHEEVPWLRAMHVIADGTLVHVDERQAHGNRRKIAAGNVVLLAQLLGLLAVFIGDDLTLHLVRETWPKLPLNTLYHGKGY